MASARPTRVYLDHNATTSVEPDVLDAMLPFLTSEYGNAASIHGFGQRARAAVENAREQVASLIGARPQEIIFTSGGTESDNHAIFEVVQTALAARASASSSAAHVITSAIEHEADVMTCAAELLAEARAARAVWTTPKIAWLSDSVPPLVKIISWGRAPIREATCSRAFYTAARALWSKPWTASALP